MCLHTRTAPRLHVLAAMCLHTRTSARLQVPAVTRLHALTPTRRPTSPQHAILYCCSRTSTLMLLEQPIQVSTLNFTP
uniref:Predicted protein n=1 Tax=Hordeum vulgare subsp. vulgare TaxID=112509 RepID=F2EJD6_HORVV|nr:predicted protein [Hordeum vulgare subsp. vulgare]